MTPGVAERVRAELVQTHYSRMPASALSSALGACAYLVVVHAMLPAWQWMLWGGLMLAQLAARMLLWLAHRRRRHALTHSEGWAWAAALGSAVAGAGWAAGLWLAMPPHEQAYALLFVLLTAMQGSLSINASTSLLRVFYAFTALACLPVGVWLALHDAHLMRVLGWMGLATLPLLCAYAHQLHRSLVQALCLRFENTELLREVMVRKEQAEADNRKKSMFLAAASHDLRQPLHAMALQAHLLEGTALRAEQVPMVGSLRASIDALQGLFNALLDMSRLDAGLVDVQSAPVPLRALFQRLAREHGATAETKQLGLRLRTGDWAVQTDPHLLALLLGNLLSNALRYTDQGGVLLSARRCGQGLQVEVWDTGRGIDPAQQKDVFKPFFQGREAEGGRSCGSGLGLAIVQRLSQRLGVSVALRSQPGRGSRFSVWLPLAASPAEPVPARSAAGAPDMDGFEGAHVLVVDGEADIRAAMQTLLMGWGCRVSTAATPDEALSQAADMASAPQLLICSQWLSPQLSGLQLIERLRDEFNSDLPALVVTGDTSTELARAVQQAGCDGLYKPVDPASLRRRVHALLRPERTLTLS